MEQKPEAPAAPSSAAWGEALKNYSLILIALILTGMAVSATRAIVVPVLFMLVLVVLLTPAIERLSRWVPYWASTAIVVVGLAISSH